jgi:hypothetical protein
MAYFYQEPRIMDHESLNRKLARLEEEIRLAQSRSLSGTELLAKVSLSLDDAIRVAANIRNRLAGVLRPNGRQSQQHSTEPATN